MSLVALALVALLWVAFVLFCVSLGMAASRGDTMGDWRNDEWPYNDDPPDPL